MAQTNDAYILTDFQLQFLLQGCRRSSLYGLPQKNFVGDFEALYYQIHDLAVRKLLTVSERAFDIAKPLKEWLFAAADAKDVFHILASGQPPRAFCAYMSDEIIVTMERYPYQENSIRLLGVQKPEFYEEIRQILESCGIKEPKAHLPKEAVSKELLALKQHLCEEYEKKNYEMTEKFSVEVCSRTGEHKKRISVIRHRLEDCLVEETEHTAELFPFGMDKLAEMLENI